MNEETRPDTATEDAETVAPLVSAVVVPDALARLGYEAMQFGPANLWGVTDDQYIYKPLRAWDAAQREVDDVIAKTGGSVFTLASAMLATLRGVAEMKPGEVDGVEETREEFEQIRFASFQQMVNQNWSAFLHSCPSFGPAAFASAMIKKCDVRRLPTVAEQAKPDGDPSKDHGGYILGVKGAGAPDVFYRGRRQQLLRIGLAAFWGSCGDFFVGR